MGKAIDVSVLGYSAEDVAGMDADERADTMREVLNRAADILQSAADAFAAEMGGQRADVLAAAQSVIEVARITAPGAAPLTKSPAVSPSCPSWRWPSKDVRKR